MKLSRITLLVILGSAGFSVLHAQQERKSVFTDEQAAGIEFQIQGEYAGTLGSNDRKWGAHIIAVGNGKFQSIGYRGGLPGAGWKKEAGEYHSGQLEDGVAKITAERFRLEVDGQTLKVFSLEGNSFGALKKVHRKSPTLGMKPPQNAIVLFDGTSLDGWENAKLVEGNLLGATGCSTKRSFGNHRLHLEFRTPFMPEATGQARGNSGVYVQSRYEVQVLDSFGLEGKDNECGGIYQVSKPSINMCFPPLAWQTYDIDFTSAQFDQDGSKTKNARITVKLNGVIIQDDLELPRDTPGRAKEGPEPLGLFLQDHGNPVVYRNIWVVEE
jgi:hypothetical protein